MSIGLEGALRTCKVDTGWASRIQSDRFENPNLMVCPVWNGRDLSGRPVCADSFYTKRAGCNSALDRVDVENYQRPQYMEYINLDAAGIYANIYKDNAFYNDAGIQERFLHNSKANAGHFGGVASGATNQAPCLYPTGAGSGPKNVTSYQNSQMQMGNFPKQNIQQPSGMGGASNQAARSYGRRQSR